MASRPEPQPDDAIYIAPIGGGADDWPRLNQLMTFWAYKRRIVMLPGTWNCATTGATPNGTHIVMSAGVNIVSTLPSGGFTGFLFRQLQVTAALGVLSAAPTMFSNQISVSVAPTVNTWIWIGQGADTYLAARYFVRAVAGVGPFTVTLDRPVVFNFANGESVRSLTSAPQDIIIEFNGATVTGTGDRIIEFVGAWNCHISGCKFSPASGAFVSLGSLDIGSLESTMTDMGGSFYGATAGYGWFLESSERCKLTLTGADYASNANIMFDCVDCVVEDGFGGESTNSGMLVTSNLMVHGCLSCIVRGGAYHGGANIGVAVGFATDLKLDDVHVGGHVTNIDVGSGVASGPTRTRITNCTSERGSTYGVRVRATAVATRLEGHASNADATSLHALAAIDLVNADLNNYTASGIIIDAAITAGTMINIVNGRIASNVSASLGVDWYGPAYVLLSGVRFEMNTAAANSTCVFYRNAALGLCTVRNCYGTQASACNGVYLFAGANTLRVEGGTNFSGFTAPYTITAGSYINRALVVLTAAVAVVVPFPNLRVNEAPKLTRTVVNGGTGLAPLVVLTPGTGFTITSVALDLDTYQWEVGS